MERLLPSTADNAYRGHRLALWLFGVLLAMKALIAGNSTFNGHFVAGHADGIPLDTFTPPGTQTVVSLFGIWGLGQLVGCLLGLIVLLRYRTLIPLMFALLLLELLTKKLFLFYVPVAEGGPASVPLVTYVQPALMIAGLVLSLWTRRGDRISG